MPRHRIAVQTDHSRPLDAEVEGLIYVVRGRRVMIDVDLARLYGVTTKQLNQQVRRNLGRFPDDFLFQLTTGEADAMRSQIVTASPRRRNVRFRPFAFTEHGVTMLSAVLRSPQAIAVSVTVVRAFVRLRHAIAGHAELAHRVDGLERRYDGQFNAVFDALRQVLKPEPAERPRIGFNRDP